MKLVEKLKSKYRRAAFKLQHDYLTIDKVVLALAVVLCAAWTWGAISSMSRNWELEQRLDARKKELALVRLEVQTLELENQYLQSEEYQELAARKQQNKKLAGENLVYLPPNTETAKNKYKLTVVTEEQATPSNFEQWMSFLFGA